MMPRWIAAAALACSLLLWLWPERSEMLPGPPDEPHDAHDEGTPPTLRRARGAASSRGMGAMIAGRVTDLEGRPLARARVCASAEKHADCVPSQSDGGYVFRALPAGLYRLLATAPEHLPSAAPVKISAQDAPLRYDFALPPGGVRVAGVVLDRGGGPIAAARVDALVAAGSVAITDDSGAFELALPQGPVMLHIGAPGYTATQQAVTAPSDAIRIELNPESRLIGEAVSKLDGSPLAGVVVTARPIDSQSFAPEASALTDDSGRFILDGLPEGRYELEGRGAHAFGRLPEAVSLGFAQTLRDLRLQLDRAVAVSGKVVVGAAKKPCGEAQLGLVGPNFRASASADAAGAFTIADVPPGTLDLSASCSAAAQQPALQITVGSKDLTGIELSLSEGLVLRGRVVDGHGRGIAGRNVIAAAKVDARGALKSSAEHGEFEFSGLAAGSYDVMLEQMPDVKQSITLGDSTLPAEIVLELPASGSIHVALRGAPEDLGDEWFVAAQSEHTHKIGASRGGGSYELDDLAEGQYRVTAYDTQGTSFAVDCQVHNYQTSEVVFQIPKRDGRIEGVVVDQAGMPVADARVSAIASTGAPRGSDAARFVLSAGDGSFTLDDLFKGASYDIAAISRLDGRGKLSAVAAGQHVRVVLVHVDIPATAPARVELQGQQLGTGSFASSEPTSAHRIDH